MPITEIFNIDTDEGIKNFHESLFEQLSVERNQKIKTILQLAHELGYKKVALTKPNKWREVFILSSKLKLFKLKLIQKWSNRNANN